MKKLERKTKLIERLMPQLEILTGIKIKNNVNQDYYIENIKCARKLMSSGLEYKIKYFKDSNNDLVQYFAIGSIHTRGKNLIDYGIIFDKAVEKVYNKKVSELPSQIDINRVLTNYKNNPNNPKNISEFEALSNRYNELNIVTIRSRLLDKLNTYLNKKSERSI